MRARALAILALGIPVLAGLAYLLAYGAPPRYPAINGAALAIAALWIVVTPAFGRAVRRLTLGAALLLLFLPLVTGPWLGDVARWVPLGPFQLHAGMIAIPVIAVLAGQERDHAPALLSVALLAALLQPDLASCAALTLAAFGLYDATKDWRYGGFAIVAFVASLVAAVRGELPAQPYVERVIFLLARTDPLAALGLVAALVASFYLVIGTLPGTAASRKALAGCLFGFSFAGLVSNYPSALIGYGAAPILGFGLALGWLAANGRRLDDRTEDRPPAA